MPGEIISKAEWIAASPEIAMALGAMALLMIGVLGGENRTRMIFRGTLVLLGLVFVLLVSAVNHEKVIGFAGAFTLDEFAVFSKLLIVLSAGLVLLMSMQVLHSSGLERFEFSVLLALAVLGMMMMVSASDLISAYLALELQSLSLYVMASFNRDNLRSTEAGMKYFVLGALASGMLLYGASLLYGFSGTTNFAGIAAALSGSEETPIGIVFGLVFFIAGLAFKVSAVPFHMWTPDVYEGAPTPVTAFLAAAPKFAAMALFLRAMFEPFPSISGDWQQIVIFLSSASMVLGAFAAIGQNNIKRLMAYSSIGHMGYALIGLAAASRSGASAVLIYMTIYLAMILGSFACILSLRREEGAAENISDLAGLARTQPFMAFLFAMFMFSLAGIPPLAGFFGKFYVFMAAVEAELYALAVIGVVASVVAAYYYLRVVKVMFFDDAQGKFQSMPSGTRVVLGLSSVIVLFFVFWPAPIVRGADMAASALFGASFAH
jgi:NADH-quinone oxidoreductase subunit N